MVDIYGNVVHCPLCQSTKIAKSQSGTIRSSTKLKCKSCEYRFFSKNIEDWNKKKGK